MKTKEIPARVQMWYEEQVEVVKANFKKRKKDALKTTPFIMLGTILFVLILTTYSGMKNGETLIVGFKAAILPALIGGAVMTILYIPGIKLMTGYPKAVYKRLNKTIYKMSDEELRILENH